jgi:hypothetical protein
MRVRMAVPHSEHDAVACNKSRWHSGQIDFAFLDVLEQSKALFEEIGCQSGCHCQSVQRLKGLRKPL